MQNKPNLPDTQMNASYVKRKSYEQKTMDNEPIKQSQSNPIFMSQYYVGLADSSAMRSELHPVPRRVRDVIFAILFLTGGRKSGLFVGIKLVTQPDNCKVL